MKETQDETREMPRMPPVIVWHGKRYFIDKRLQEFRPANEPFAPVRFRSPESEAMCSAFSILIPLRPDDDSSALISILSRRVARRYRKPNMTPCPCDGVTTCVNQNTYKPRGLSGVHGYRLCALPIPSLVAV